MASSISGFLTAEANTLTQAQAAQPKPPANTPQPAAQQAAPPEDTVELSSAAQTPAVQSAPKPQNTPPPPPPQTPAPTTAEVILLHLQGQTVQQIATHFGVSVQDVQSYLGTTAQT